MGRLFALLVVVVIAVVAVGLYLDWFHVSTENNGSSAKFNVTVDKDKIKEDKDRAEQNARELKDKAEKKVHGESAPK
jgi:hypothetical protein